MSVFGICVFLWLADIVERVQGGLGLLILLAIIGWSVCVFFVVGNFYIQTGDVSQKLIECLGKSKKFAVLFIVLVLCYSLTPSKQTIYMMGGTIAGSEIVGKVADSQEYQKLMELFNLTLDKQIKEIKGELNVK